MFDNWFKYNLYNITLDKDRICFQLLAYKINLTISFFYIVFKNFIKLYPIKINELALKPL